MFPTQVTRSPQAKRRDNNTETKHLDKSESSSASKSISSSSTVVVALTLKNCEKVLTSLFVKQNIAEAYNILFEDIDANQITSGVLKNKSALLVKLLENIQKVSSGELTQFVIHDKINGCEFNCGRTKSGNIVVIPEKEKTTGSLSFFSTFSSHYSSFNSGRKLSPEFLKSVEIQLANIKRFGIISFANEDILCSSYYAAEDKTTQEFYSVFLNGTKQCISADYVVVFLHWRDTKQDAKDRNGLLSICKSIWDSANYRIVEGLTGRATSDSFDMQAEEQAELLFKQIAGSAANVKYIKIFGYGTGAAVAICTYNLLQLKLEKGLVEKKLVFSLLLIDPQFGTAAPKNKPEILSAGKNHLVNIRIHSCQSWRGYICDISHITIKNPDRIFVSFISSPEYEDQETIDKKWDELTTTTVQRLIFNFLASSSDAYITKRDSGISQAAVESGFSLTPLSKKRQIIAHLLTIIQQKLRNRGIVYHPDIMLDKLSVISDNRLEERMIAFIFQSALQSLIMLAENEDTSALGRGFLLNQTVLSIVFSEEELQTGIYSEFYHFIGKSRSTSYVLGDMDGDLSRLWLAALISGHVKVNQAGMNCLKNIMLKIQTTDISGMQNRKELQKSEEYSGLLCNLILNSEFTRSEKKLIVIGDCLFDRFTNNHYATYFAIYAFSQCGVIFIKGNHDHLDLISGGGFLGIDQGAAAVEASQSKIDWKALVAKCFRNCYFDGTSKQLYIHNGISAFCGSIHLLSDKLLQIESKYLRLLVRVPGSSDENGGSGYNLNKYGTEKKVALANLNYNVLVDYFYSITTAETIISISDFEKIAILAYIDFINKHNDENNVVLWDNFRPTDNALPILYERLFLLQSSSTRVNQRSVMLIRINFMVYKQFYNRLYDQDVRSIYHGHDGLQGIIEFDLGHRKIFRIVNINSRTIESVRMDDNVNNNANNNAIIVAAFSDCAENYPRVTNFSFEEMENKLTEMTDSRELYIEISKSDIKYGSMANLNDTMFKAMIFHGLIPDFRVATITTEDIMSEILVNCSEKFYLNCFNTLGKEPFEIMSVPTIHFMGDGEFDKTKVIEYVKFLVCNTLLKPKVLADQFARLSIKDNSVDSDFCLTLASHVSKTGYIVRTTSYNGHFEISREEFSDADVVFNRDSDGKQTIHFIGSDGTYKCLDPLGIGIESANPEITVIKNILDNMNESERSKIGLPPPKNPPLCDIEVFQASGISFSGNDTRGTHNRNKALRVRFDLHLSSEPLDVNAQGVKKACEYIVNQYEKMFKHALERNDIKVLIVPNISMGVWCGTNNEALAAKLAEDQQSIIANYQASFSTAGKYIVTYVYNEEVKDMQLIDAHNKSAVIKCSGMFANVQDLKVFLSMLQQELNLNIKTDKILIGNAGDVQSLGRNYIQGHVTFDEFLYIGLNLFFSTIDTAILLARGKAIHSEDETDDQVIATCQDKEGNKHNITMNDINDALKRASTGKLIAELSTEAFAPRDDSQEGVIFNNINADDFKIFRKALLDASEKEVARYAEHVKESEEEKHAPYRTLLNDLQFDSEGNSGLSLTLYPSYSKVKKQVGCNFGGDFVCTFENNVGKIICLIDAPSTGIRSILANMGDSLKEGMDQVFANNVKRICSLLAISSAKNKGEVINKFLLNKMVMCPFVVIEETAAMTTFYLNGDANVMLVNKQSKKVVYLSAGAIGEGNQWGYISEAAEEFITRYSILYETNDYKLTLALIDNELEKISANYSKKQKNYTSPVGITITLTCDKDEYSKIKQKYFIYVVSDGTTDNSALQEKIIDNRWISVNSANAQQIIELEEQAQTRSDLKPDDVAFLRINN